MTSNNKYKLINNKNIISLSLMMKDITTKNNIIRLYAPDIFFALRKKWLKSRNKPYNDLNYYINNLNFDFKNSKKGDGKSEMLFIDSGPFLIKQLKENEFNYFINKLIVPYYEHMKNYKNSLLLKFYGMYEIEGMKFVVLNKVDIDCNGGSKIKYDLKGSRVNKKSKSTTKIEGDFGNSEIIFNNKKKHEKFIKQLKNDTKFLKENNLIDYSLFVVICKNSNKSKNSNNTDISNFKAILYNNNQDTFNIQVKCSIIDFLQNYNKIKKFQSTIKTAPERFTTKSFKLQKSIISAIPPENYKIRFDKYINTHFRNNYNKHPKY